MLTILTKTTQLQTNNTQTKNAKKLSIEPTATGPGTQTQATATTGKDDVLTELKRIKLYPNEGGSEIVGGVKMNLTKKFNVDQLYDYIFDIFLNYCHKLESKWVYVGPTNIRNNEPKCKIDDYLFVGNGMYFISIIYESPKDDRFVFNLLKRRKYTVNITNSNETDSIGITFADRNTMHEGFEHWIRAFDRRVSLNVYRSSVENHFAQQFHKQLLELYPKETIDMMTFYTTTLFPFTNVVYDTDFDYQCSKSVGSVCDKIKELIPNVLVLEPVSGCIDNGYTLKFIVPKYEDIKFLIENFEKADQRPFYSVAAGNSGATINFSLFSRMRLLNGENCMYFTYIVIAIFGYCGFFMIFFLKSVIFFFDFQKLHIFCR